MTALVPPDRSEGDPGHVNDHAAVNAVLRELQADVSGALVDAAAAAAAAASPYASAAATSASDAATSALNAASYDAYSAKSSNYTAVLADRVLNVTGTTTITLPAAAGVTGHTYQIVNTGSGVVTIDGNASELVGGSLTVSLGSKGFLHIVSTGTAWLVLSGSYWDESVGRRQFAWDTVNNRWQMVYGDTGWRDVSASITSSWTTATLKIRRINNVCTLAVKTLNAATSSASTFLNNISGFRPVNDPPIFGMLWNNTASAPKSFGNNGTAFYQASYSATATSFEGQMVYITDDAWPATLPGTASGTIPFN